VSSFIATLQKAPPCAEGCHVLIVKIGPSVRARRDPKNKVTRRPCYRRKPPSDASTCTEACT